MQCHPRTPLPQKAVADTFGVDIEVVTSFPHSPVTHVAPESEPTAARTIHLSHVYEVGWEWHTGLLSGIPY